jgi:hypothetical protein
MKWKMLEKKSPNSGHKFCLTIWLLHVSTRKSVDIPARQEKPEMIFYQLLKTQYAT